MYFGLSFSKIGCDFRVSLIPIFSLRLLENFRKSIREALRNFEINIDKYTLIDKSHTGIPWKMKNEDPLQPPDSLLEFYPLADFLNNVLNAFNKLKLCPAIAILNEIVTCLQDALLTISKSLIILYSQEQQAFTTNSKDAFTRLCMSFSDDLVPYIQKCIHIIYPPSNIASKLGINVNSLQEEGITFLDKNIVIDPIKHLLPVKIDPTLILDFCYSKDSNGEADKEDITTNVAAKEIYSDSKEIIQNVENVEEAASGPADIESKRDDGHSGNI